ncbi:single-stranded DNA-binding protein [Mesomycoplasma ovipneumoniae]|uniref:Single-stranded DNA-binding protein n=1 Tax=Mesomycoplasma ovipneumoniae TaxID=29562 RepID=A0AAJ2UDJ8_9BACT|nr:single-stranded DNA-binding protein [Mesomycoplasma ovipneumoniae]MDW2829533.1 single-stranded DNA-binding protein [Mesomycoplasma ovipneumoniae]MDW2870613.1 single-stranded DNA-binding protein [Mesomycoplasma ovipneumoniae]MDW2893649.1 single-stranded DNA-binding protein [Mesomycoplasma ovipneumoniae]MDW2921789.1 single-stranded DNA-binding protein [Mesomycoplasma ovipneumoniae]
MENQVNLIGRLTNFVSFKSSNNKHYIYFNLAVGNNSKTDFFTIFGFNEKFLKLAEWVTKGSPLAVRCKLKSFVKNNKRELTLILEDFKLLETKKQFEKRKEKNFETLNFSQPNFDKPEDDDLIPNNDTNIFEEFGFDSWDLSQDQTNLDQPSDSKNHIEVTKEEQLNFLEDFVAE